MNDFVSMEMNIWNNKYASGMYDYKAEQEDLNEFKKIFANFGRNDKDCFLIKNSINYISILSNFKDFNPEKGDEILFKIRKSLKKDNKFEIINPINKYKIYSKKNDIDLNNKIWFPVKNADYLKDNILNYNLNINDVVRFGKKIYIINKMHFAFEKNLDENFYKNNNISYISLINKNSKSIFIFDLKPNQYKISNKKNINKINEVNKANGINKINKTNEINKENEINKAYDINEQKLKDSNKNYNENNQEFKNKGINTMNSNSISSKATTQNSFKTGTYNQSTSVTIKTKEATNLQLDNESDSDSENEYEKCWLCLSSFSDINNPLICLCNCHNYIHFKCLEMYLTSKFVVTENLKRTVITYTCKKFNCDICLKPYYLRFRIPEFDKTYELIDLNLPEETDYFCLESLDYVKDNNNIKTVHIVQLNDEEIKIGRSNFNDIIDNDSSVSRDHAVLKYNKNNRTLFLENKNGKYGTLVLVRGNIKVNEEKTHIQIGNTKISMDLTDKKKFNNIDKESSNIILYNAIYEKNSYYNDDDNDNDNDNYDYTFKV